MLQRPLTVSLPVRRRFADPSLWQQIGQEVCLGCTTCPELQFCGGLSIKAPVYNCLDLCCGNHKTCLRYACPNQARYSALINEVGGLTLRPYLSRAVPMPRLPDYVPAILDAGRLSGPLSIPAVAISLYSVIDTRTGLSKFSTRQEMLQRFKVHPDASVILFGSGKDRSVENFWHAMQPKITAETLRKLRPSLVTTPNFSMHTDTIRHDNLLSMSRIVSCFEGFAAAGLPVALHVNGRTPHDFARWTEFLIASPTIGVIAYEMGTLGRSSSRRAWHAKQLVTMAENVGRPLTLVVRAGWTHLSDFLRAFARVIAVDTTANMKAKYCQKARRLQNRTIWETATIGTDESIDDLLCHNIRVRHREARRLLSGQRTSPKFNTPISTQRQS